MFEDPEDELGKKLLNLIKKTERNTLDINLIREDKNKTWPGLPRLIVPL